MTSSVVKVGHSGQAGTTLSHTRVSYMLIHIGTPASSHTRHTNCWHRHTPSLSAVDVCFCKEVTQPTTNLPTESVRNPGYFNIPLCVRVFDQVCVFLYFCMQLCVFWFRNLRTPNGEVFYSSLVLYKFLFCFCHRSILDFTKHHFKSNHLLIWFWIICITFQLRIFKCTIFKVKAVWCMIMVFPFIPVVMCV